MVSTWWSPVVMSRRGTLVAALLKIAWLVSGRLFPVQSTPTSHWWWFHFSFYPAATWWINFGRFQHSSSSVRKSEVWQSFRANSKHTVTDKQTFVSWKMEVRFVKTDDWTGNSSVIDLSIHFPGYTRKHWFTSGTLDHSGEVTLC